MQTRKVNYLKRAGAAFSMIVFPIMLLIGFVLHPNILNYETITDAAEWAAEWKGNAYFHIGHLLVLFAVPFIIFASVRLMALLNGDGALYGFTGGVLASFCWVLGN